MNYYSLHHINPEHGSTSCAINTEKRSNKRTKKPSNTSEDLGWPRVDYVTSLQTQNVLASMLCLKKNLEDEEAVIKMKKLMRQRRHIEAHNSFNALTCDEEEEHRHVEVKKGTKMEVEAGHELRAPALHPKPRHGKQFVQLRQQSSMKNIATDMS